MLNPCLFFFIFNGEPGDLSTLESNLTNHCDEGMDFFVKFSVGRVTVKTMPPHAYADIDQFLMGGSIIT